MSHVPTINRWVNYIQHFINIFKPFMNRKDSLRYTPVGKTLPHTYEQCWQKHDCVVENYTFKKPVMLGNWTHPPSDCAQRCNYRLEVQNTRKCSASLHKYVRLQLLGYVLLLDFYETVLHARKIKQDTFYHTPSKGYTYCHIKCSFKNIGKDYIRWTIYFAVRNVLITCRENKKIKTQGGILTDK